MVKFKVKSIKGNIERCVIMLISYNPLRRRHLKTKITLCIYTYTSSTHAELTGDVKNSLLDSVGEGEGWMICENGIETCILS